MPVASKYVSMVKSHASGLPLDRTLEKVSDSAGFRVGTAKAAGATGATGTRTAWGSG